MSNLLELTFACVWIIDAHTMINQASSIVEE